MKKLLFATAFALLCLSANAQSLMVKDLSRSVGSWEGKLTYLDYSSGEPYTMLANIKIGLTDDKMGYVMGYVYPKEPRANATDTTFIIDNYFGKEKIVDFKKDSKGGFKMTTEIDGIDGNDNKKAVIRHIYHLKSNTLSVRKEVKFEGTNKWIKRNEYLLKRVAN